MTRFRAIFLSGALLTAAPAMAQSQSQGGGGPGGGGGALPSSMQTEVGAPAAPGNIGALEHQTELEKFAFEKSGSSKAKAFETKAEDFIARSAADRDSAMALGRAARSGQPLTQSSDEIRTALEGDLDDWRRTFKISRQDFKAIHDQLVPKKADLSAGEWAVRRAQWFEARDQWIDDQRKSLGIPTGN